MGSEGNLNTFEASLNININLNTYIMNSDKMFEAILAEQNAHYPKNTDDVAYNYDNIDEFSSSENSIKIIFDQVNFKILYISSTIESLGGYTYEEMTQDNMAVVFSVFAPEHSNALFNWIKWSMDMFTQTGTFTNYRGVLCGLKVYHKAGHQMRIMIRHRTIEEFENKMPKIAAVTIDNVSHLMKGDFYWGRSEFGEPENKHYHYLLSTDEKNVPMDIISNREKDVLRLIAQGMDSKEIGKTLFISPNTVDNHRRNMLKRTGMRDLTALIQVCWMCNII